MSLDVTDTTVAVPGGDVFTRRWRPGRDARTPVVLLHDSLGSVAQWRDFPAALAQATGRTVVACDRLGYGQSSPRTAAPTADFIRDEAAVLFPAVMRGLGIDAYIPFGHSVGGGMALLIAALHPDRCRAVITEAAQPAVEERTLEGIRAAKAGFERPGQLERLARWHGDKARWVLDAWTETWLSPVFRDWTLDAWLPQVRCPVLAIHGDHDEFGSTAFPQRIADGVRGPSRAVVLAGCGHVPHREKADEVLRLVRAFLDESAV